MPSANITALTNAAAFAPDALFYMAASPFGVTDDRKITGSTLFTTISPLNNNTAALVVTNSAVPTVPQVVFTNSGGTRRMQVSMAGAASITDTFDDVSIFSSIAAETLSLGIWNATDTGVGAELFLYTGAAGLAHLRIRATDGGAGNGNFLDVPNSGVLFTSNASPGGLILCTDEATAPIIFAAGDNAFSAEKGRFDAAGFTLGKASSITGALNLANAASAFLTTITAGNAAAARTYVWPTNFGAAGSVLTDAAGNGTLSWAAASGSGTVNAGTQFQMAYYATSAAAVSGLSNLVTDASGTLSHAATARSTGAPTFYNRIVTPADTGLTASAETVGIQFGGNTSAATVIRQHATGALTTQREYLFVAPTYSFVGASTLTTAATVAITGAPAQGTNATITNQAALWVQTGGAAFNVSGGTWGDATGMVVSNIAAPGTALLVANSGSPTLQQAGNNYGIQIQPADTGILIIGGNGTNQIFKDSTPTKAVSFGMAVPGVAITDNLIFARYNGSAWAAMITATNAESALLINTSTVNAMLYAVSSATTLIGLRIDSPTNTTVDLAQFNLIADDTNTVANIASWQTNSNGSAANGFGSSFTFNLESTTTNDRNAARLAWSWTDATDATRTADVIFQNVHLAAALATTFTIRSNGYYLWLGAKRVSSQFDKTDETLANITGLSVNVAAGRTYAFEATLYTTSNVAGGVKFAIAGTATATAITYEAVDCQGGLTVATGTQRAAALATAVGDVTAVTTAYVRITGTITVNAAGTLTVQSARNAATGTTSVLVGSVFIVNEIS